MSITGWVVDIHGELIKGTSSPTEEELLLDVGPDQVLVLEAPSSMTARWNGAAWIERPVSPGSYAEWNRATAIWFDPRSLEKAKADQWTVIKAQRSVLEFGGFTWDGSSFDSDAQSQSRVQGGAQLATLATLASQAFSVDWTLSDNNVRTLTGPDMLAVGQAMGVHIMTVHGIGRVLREAIDAATTINAVEGITWPL